MTIFDWLNQISYDKRSWSSFNNEDRESFNPYMINRFISMKGDYIDFVNTIQKHSKPKKSKFNSELITILSKHFKVSKREIKDSYHLIGKDYSKIILQNNSIDDKQIKKLLK